MRITTPTALTAKAAGKTERERDGAKGRKEIKSERREEGKTRGDCHTENSVLRYCRSFNQTRVVGFVIPC